MNNLELRMVDKLKELKVKHGAVSVRAEFEAEGTKIEELLRLKEICMLADMKLTLKIGGCESIRDMLEARTVGVNNLVAPMVESPYALSKYLQAIIKVFPEDEKKRLEILTNIETKTACEKFEKMVEISEIKDLNGIVVERVDLCTSMGLDDSKINDEAVGEIVIRTAKKAKEKNIKTIIGGGISAESIPFLKKNIAVIDRYETRKITFDSKNALDNNPEKGILKALGFELLWLKNKMEFYGNIRTKDQARMNLIEHRYWYEIDSQL